MTAMDAEYRQFTKPAELHKAINMLRGIIAGLSTDRNVDGAEIQELVHWCSLHANLRDRHPFSEILPIVENACSDGIISDEEAQDILWVCSSFAAGGNYYDNITSSIQFLSGMIHGIMADAELSDKEVLSLQSWIDANDFLARTYPFDEINSLLSVVLQDRQIDAEERDMLMAFFSNIIEFKDSLNLSEKDFSDLREKYTVSGICASCPDIKFYNRTFCFTGESIRGSRKILADAVRAHGGIARSAVSAKTDYLVVGNAGNPCWAYACYGRKIEEAMSFRKEGVRIQIINENDFWDAVEDATSEILDF